MRGRMSFDKELVCIVDDDAGVRSLIRRLVESVGLKGLGFPSATSFLESTQARSPGCLVLDLRMPGMSGLELQEALRSERRSIPIVFLTAYGNLEVATEAMAGGAFYVLAKPVENQRLLDCIQAAVSRGVELDQERQVRQSAMERVAALTPREQEVLFHVARGHRSLDIAKRLRLKKRTVDSHRFHLEHKLGMRSLADLIKLSSDLGKEGWACAWNRRGPDALNSLFDGAAPQHFAAPQLAARWSSGTGRRSTLKAKPVWASSARPAFPKRLNG